MALNFGLLGDAGAPAMGYLQGQQDVTRNQLAQQQVETGRMTQDKMRMEMDAMNRRQAGLDKFMARAKELGVNGDPEQLTQAYFEHATSTGDPNEIKAAMIAVQTARERKDYMASQPGAGGAVATPVPMTNNLGTALPAAGAPAQVNAMTPPAAAPPQGNALAGNRLSQIENRLLELRRFPTAGEKERTELIKERDRLMTPHVVAGNLVSGAGNVLFTAPQNVTPTDTARLIKERDALPPGDPNRALYDRQIRDLGASAQNARDRLAFDQSKFNYEKANPGKTIKEITQADGSTQVVAIDNRTGMATQVMMAGAPSAAPAGAGRGAVGVTDGQVGPGTPLVGAAKAGALTEAQGNAALFGSAMAQAEGVLDQVEKRGTRTGPVTTSLAQGIVKYVPLGVGDKLVGDVYSLAMQDPSKLFGPDVDQQKLGQAQLAFAIAYLRKTSGAAFGPSELANTVNEFFPAIGEDATVTKQKSEARKRAIRGMKISAGKEGSKFIEEYEAPGAAGGGTPSANDPLGIRGK